MTPSPSVSTVSTYAAAIVQVYHPQKGREAGVPALLDTVVPSAATFASRHASQRDVTVTPSLSPMFPPRRTNPQHAAVRDPDTAIRATDTDAAQARVSAVRKQYLRDPFISSLVQRPHLIPARPPLINVGTYVRSEALDELVVKWLECSSIHGGKVQIVSLGAGSDTRFWRLATGQLFQRGHLRELLARYLELDFADNTARKIEAIRRKSELGSVVGEFNTSGCSLTSDIYSIQDVDLRDFSRRFSEFLAPRSSGEDESGNFIKPLLDPSLPTLVIAECVLVYMKQEQSDALIKWFADSFSVVGAIVYEMFGLNDSFGRVMKENLRTRNVALPGVDAYPTLEAQCGRFIKHGYTSAHALSLRTIRSEYIEADERRRIGKLELLDEIEELELVLGHYVISWALKQPVDGSRAVSEALASWGLTPKAKIDALDDGAAS